MCQIQAKQKKLNTAKNQHILNMESGMQKKLYENYPNASNALQERIKAKVLKRIGNYKPQFLINKDERWAKFSKPLNGYVSESDLKKLDKKIGVYFDQPLTRA